MQDYFFTYCDVQERGIFCAAVLSNGGNQPGWWVHIGPSTIRLVGGHTGSNLVRLVALYSNAVSDWLWLKLEGYHKTLLRECCRDLGFVATCSAPGGSLA